jgi:TQXA domain-containing protein
MHCIDIHTDTWLGVGYGLGTWDAANVPNVGYVARVLEEYYPNTNEPANLTDLNQKAAAVQAAVWFFSDRYVLDTSDPIHDTVAGIVDHVISQGPLVQPPPPSLTINPTQVSGPASSALGPYTVNTDAASATVNATGAIMYSDSAGTTPIANGASVPSGQKIWLRSTGSSSGVLQATSQAIVPSGNVYLYDGNWAGVNNAQKLILAESATLTTTVQATAEFLPPGSLIVTKTIAGSGAGTQGQVVIHVACDDGVTRDDFVINAHTPAGDYTKHYDNIAAGTLCTVTETANGSVVGTKVVVTGDGQQVTIPSGGSATVHITDTYHNVGSLIVSKTIAGPGAGQQGQVTIHTECGGTALTPDFVIPAGTRAGTYTTQYDDIPVPTTCTVTETADGSTSAVSVVVEGSGQTVSIAAGEIAQADISDTYGLVPGQLEVTKTIAGPGAGQQGEIRIQTACNGAPLSPDFVIPAGTPAGDQSQLYSNIPAPATCTVTETEDGHNTVVSVAVDGSGQTVSVPAGGAGAAHITDVYQLVPGQLEVTKTITGPAAGQQGPVTIHTECNGTVLTPDLVLDSMTPAGDFTQLYSGLPVPATCKVTETADGSTSTVSATVDGSGQTVSIPPGGGGTAHIIDSYGLVPGQLEVTKTIAGPSAGLQGQITIHTVCNGSALTPDFVIPAGAPAGQQSHTYSDVAPASCLVTETQDGSTGVVTAVVEGSGQAVTVPAGGTGVAHITDTYGPIFFGPDSGSLLVTKTIAGPLAGHQGPVSLQVVCDGNAQSPDFVIPAGTHKGSVSRSFNGIPAGSVCTVTETKDGATATVTATVAGNGHKVTIPAGKVATVNVMDVYRAARGNLVVSKTIGGPAARKHGLIGILVVCGGPLHKYVFLIRADTGAGSVTRHFPGLPAGSVCTVTEIAVGHTQTVAVIAIGKRQKATISAHGTATVKLSDNFVRVIKKRRKPVPVTG